MAGGGIAIGAAGNHKLQEPAAGRRKRASRCFLPPAADRRRRYRSYPLAIIQGVPLSTRAASPSL